MRLAVEQMEEALDMLTEEERRVLRSMELELSGIRMESDAVLRDGSSAFTATIKAKRRVDHSSILAQINKLDGVDYLEEI